LQGSRVEHKVETHKLLVSHNDAIIKIEVSEIVRCVLAPVEEKYFVKKLKSCLILLLLLMWYPRDNCMEEKFALQWIGNIQGIYLI
jgi:hypothetical protein